MEEYDAEVPSDASQALVLSAVCICALDTGVEATLRISTLRAVVTLVLVAGQTAVGLTLWVLSMDIGDGPGFSGDELSGSLMIVLPMFAAHVTVAVQYYFGSSYSRRQGRKVSAMQAFLAVLFPSLLAVCLLLASFLKAYSALGWESFRTSLGLFEALFGVYTAIVVRFLFDHREGGNDA